MNQKQTFVTYAQSPEMVQLGDGAFNHPPGLAGITAVCSSTFGNLVLNAALLHCQTVSAPTVNAIALYRLGLFQWPSSPFSNRMNGVSQWQQLCDVMSISLGENDINRGASRIDEEVVLATRLTAIGWVRSTFFDMHSKYRRNVGNDTGKTELFGATQCTQQYAVQLAPCPGFLLGTHAARACHTGAASHFLRQHFSRKSRLQNKQNSCQNAPVVQRFGTGLRLAPSPGWQ